MSASWREPLKPAALLLARLGREHGARVASCVRASRLVDRQIGRTLAIRRMSLHAVASIKVIHVESPRPRLFLVRATLAGQAVLTGGPCTGSSVHRGPQTSLSA